MRQRVMIAMAIACEPDVLIADEPTTALDVTIQAGVLDVMKDLRARLGMAIVLITHDLGVVADVAERSSSCTRGARSRRRTVAELFADPRHPYTIGLLEAVPRVAGSGRLQEIPGIVPSRTEPADECVFAPRCPRAQDVCREKVPPLEDRAACFYPGRAHERARGQRAAQGVRRRRRARGARGRRGGPDDRRRRGRRAGRGVRQRQVDGRQLRAAAARADGRHGQAQRHRHHDDVAQAAAAAAPRRCTWSSRTRSPRSTRACRRATRSASRCACTARPAGAGWTGASPSCSTRSGCARSCATATRTSSPAASASASGWRGRCR